MKKYFKRTSAVLLIATSFNILPMISASSSGVLTFAEELKENDEVDLRHGLIEGAEIVKSHGKNYIHYKNIPFYVDPELYDRDATFRNEKKLLEEYEKAKEKIQDKQGVTYPDNNEISIYFDQWVNNPRIFDHFFPYEKSITLYSQIFARFDFDNLVHQMANAARFFKDNPKTAEPNQDLQIITSYDKKDYIHYQDLQIVTCNNKKDYIRYLDMPFYIDQKSYSEHPEFYLKDKLNAMYEKAKEKVKNISYPDNNEISIYIEPISEPNAISSFFRGGKLITMNPEYFNPDDLGYEMDHAAHSLYAKDGDKPIKNSRTVSYSDMTITYTEPFIEPNTEFVSFDGEEYAHREGTPFYVDKMLYSLHHYSKNKLDKLYKEAKEKIQSNIGLTYPDELQTPIYIGDIEKWDTSGYFSPHEKRIKVSIENYDKGGTLPHEMTHALLSHSLGKSYKNLNLGLDEGFATQNNKLGHFNSTELPTQNKCFGDFYPTGNEAKSIYYALHQFMTHDWIKSEGKEVVKKFIDKVKNGENSVKAFLDLGGDKIAEKYNCSIESSIEKNENLIFKLFTDFISSAKKFFGFK